MRARELMTTPAFTCRVDDDASVAAQVMWDHDCGAVPVVDRDGHVAGIVTDRDICMAAHTRGLPLSAIRIATVMSADVCTCTPDDDIGEVERRMGVRQVRRVPVVDSEYQPIGMLSVADVALGVQRNGGTARRLWQDLVTTVALISERRAGYAALGTEPAVDDLADTHVSDTHVSTR